MARAAARSDSYELLDGEAPPTAGPISLTGLIKLRPSTRGRNSKWKPLSFHDLDEPDAATDSEHDLTNARGDPRLDSLISSGTQGSFQTDRLAGQYLRHTDTVRSQFIGRNSAHEEQVHAAQDPQMIFHDRNALERYIAEIQELISDKLHDPEFLQCRSGFADGEIQFIQHTNADISAHQWDSLSQQWTNIGQYSYGRKRVEGHLASERLKGQKIGQAMPQNTVRYFVAVAKQREAALIAKTEPELSSQYQSTKSYFTNSLAQTEPRFAPRTMDVNAERAPSLSSRSFQSQPLSFPTLSAINTTGPAKPLQHTEFASLPDGPFMSAVSSKTHNTNLSEDAFNGSQDPGTMDFTFRFPPHLSHTGRVMDSPQSAHTTIDVNRRQHYADQERARIQQTLWPQQRVIDNFGDTRAGGSAAATDLLPSFRGLDLGSLPDPSRTTQQPAYGTTLPVDVTTSSRSAGTLLASSGRDAMLDYLNRIGDTAFAHPSADTGPARTVLHDPYQAGPSIASATEPSHASQPTSTASQILLVAANHSQPIHPPSLEPPQSSGSFGSMSSGEPLDGWRNREVDIINFTSPVHLTNDELQQWSRPRPQRWRGPFFEDSIPTANDLMAPLASRKSELQELDEWWTSGRLAERQGEFYGLLVAGKSGRLRPVEGKADVSRLFVPLYERLMAYVEGPEESRHGYFARFVPPKEEWIDRSAQGSKSLFRGVDVSKLEAGRTVMAASLAAEKLEERPGRAKLQRMFDKLDRLSARTEDNWSAPTEDYWSWSEQGGGSRLPVPRDWYLRQKKL